MSNPFRYFNSSPEVIRLVVMMYVRYPLSLRNVEDLLADRGIDICYETVRFWWNRFGPMFAAEIRKKRVARARLSSVALAFGRGVCEGQRQALLSLARRRS
jgi:putative transposase